MPVIWLEPGQELEIMGPKDYLVRDVHGTILNFCRLCGYGPDASPPTPYLIRSVHGDWFVTWICDNCQYWIQRKSYVAHD